MRVHRIEPVDALIELEFGPLAAQVGSGAADDVSIAVLPFDNLSRDATDQLLCDGITIDVIDRLSRFRELAVIARHSAFQCRSLTHAPDEVGAVLGARYLALGTVRRSGKRLRVTAQLIEAAGGQLLWSDNFDCEIADIFDLQDEIADVISARLAHQVNAAERRRTIRTQNALVGVYGMVLRGQDLMFQFREDANSHARHIFEEAAAVDPNYARVYSGLSRTYSEAWRCRWGDPASDFLDHAVRLAQAAIDHDEGDARGFAELGYARLYRKELHDSLGAYERAIALNPNNADVLAEMSDVLTCLGSPDRAVELMQRAFRLNPGYPDWYLCYYAEALFDLERYQDVVDGLSRMRDQTEGLKLLAASNALLGRLAEARRFADEIRRTQPKFSLSDWQNVPPNIESTSQQRYFEGLRLAGLR
jgi:adenylate cyclase